MKNHSCATSNRLVTAVALALGVSVLPQPAAADILDFSWTGYLRLLAPDGSAIANTSITQKGANRYETPLSGTLSIETTTGAGTATMLPFDFFNAPSDMSGINLQAIGDGMGGPGTLMMGNMLWCLNACGNGIPVSLVWDASGFFGAVPGLFQQGAGFVIDGSTPGSVRGAADGTYVGGSGMHITSGYLDLGVVPIATTKWNTTPLCNPGYSGDCLSVNPSGGLPLVADAAANPNDYNALFMGGDGSLHNGIGGSPMPAGPFESYSLNIDITSLVFDQIIAVAPVPVPAAAWLLGSGLLGLVGLARRRV